MDYLGQCPGANSPCPCLLVLSFSIPQLLSQLLLSLSLLIPFVIFLPLIFSFEPLRLVASQLLPAAFRHLLLVSLQLLLVASVVLLC